MHSKNRRKKPSDYTDITSEDKDENNRQISTSKRNLSIDTQPFSDLSTLAGNEKSVAYVSHLLQEADLPALVQLDSIEQIKYFLDERGHLINQLELIRTQYEKQYGLLKRRLDETENENERLTTEHRSASKELLLYKNLFDASNNPDPPAKSQDYQQLRLTIDKILEENQFLYAELNHFKTSDPVYEQVQILEATNKHLQQELYQSFHENNHLRKRTNLDEIKHLKLRLTKTLEECEQLKLSNKKLLQQQQRQISPSPNQVRHSSSPSSPLSNPQQPNSHRSSRTSFNENLPLEYSPNEVVELREHVQRLEQTLYKRDNELHKLQNEIEKGTTSIMSSIEDLYIVSTNVSPSTSPLKQRQPSIEHLQNELDQLHDKLDELTRENQILQNRTQEFDTIYEENEYLYAEKSQYNEEFERSRLRQLVLEQENNSLKEREKDLLTTNDTTNNSNLSQLQLKIEWFSQTNSQLELEIVRLREQTDLITRKYDQAKRDLIEKNQHYKQILEAAEDAQKLPHELARIEKLNSDMERQFENERQEYEKTIIVLEEQSQQREQKYSSLYDTIIKLQNDYRQKELDIVHQMNDIVKQRDTFHTQLTSFQHVYEQLQEENRSLKDEISSKNEINRDLKFALTSSNNDAQTIYSQLRQLNSNLNDSQQRYDHEIAERDCQLENLRTEQKQIIANYDAEILKFHQTIIQLQHDNNQYCSQLERYQLNITKLQTEINEKQNFIQQIQNDLAERSALHVSINNQLSQENKIKTMKITELEQALAQEQQYKTELQRKIEELRQSHRNPEESERHSNEPIGDTLRNELIIKSDQNTALHHTIEDEKLKRERLEMKLRRLKDEYVSVRKDLYNRTEDYNKIQHELIECHFKMDYYAQMYNQTFQSNENQSSTAVQLYLKEKADSQHWQVKCGTYQQKFEHLQKNYETIKEKYKQRLHEERDLFEQTKIKYLEHIKNVQNDLNETRKLLERDTELKLSQETAYQQLVDERRHLLTSMIDKDAKVREMRRENLLLTSKIQLLENQMETLNDRVDQTIRERSLLRRDLNGVRLDSNVSIGTSTRSSPISPASRTTTTTTTTYIDPSGCTAPTYYTESFGFNNGRTYETSAVS